MKARDMPRDIVKRCWVRMEARCNNALSRLAVAPAGLDIHDDSALRDGSGTHGSRRNAVGYFLRSTGLSPTTLPPVRLALQVRRNPHVA